MKKPFTCRPPARMTLPQLAAKISLLARQVRGWREEYKNEFAWIKSPDGLATKNDLEKVRKKIMSAISDYANKVGPKLDRIQNGLDALQTLVEQLQNSPGPITSEDQVLLNQIESKVDSIAGDAEGLPLPPAA